MRIGKKPNEADLSYTTVRTGLTHNFFGTTVREESEGRETRERNTQKLLATEGALEEKNCRAKNFAASVICRIFQMRVS